MAAQAGKAKKGPRKSRGVKSKGTRKGKKLHPVKPLYRDLYTK